MDKFIEIKIATDGTVEVHTTGYKGTECEEEIRKISRALGQPVSLKKTPEFYETHSQNEQNRQG